jgi:hypothetical protein
VCSCASRSGGALMLVLATTLCGSICPCRMPDDADALGARFRNPCLTLAAEQLTHVGIWTIARKAFELLSCRIKATSTKSRQCKTTSISANVGWTIPDWLLRVDWRCRMGRSMLRAGETGPRRGTRFASTARSWPPHRAGKAQTLADDVSSHPISSA